MALPSFAGFEGTRTTFGDDVDDDDDAAMDALLGLAPVTSQQPQKKKTRKGERDVMSGLKVKALQSRQQFGRSIPASVKSFLGDHMFGSRLNRTSVVRNRPRGNGRFRPVKNFVVR